MTSFSTRILRASAAGVVGAGMIAALPGGTAIAQEDESNLPSNAHLAFSDSEPLKIGGSENDPQRIAFEIATEDWTPGDNPPDFALDLNVELNGETAQLSTDDYTCEASNGNIRCEDYIPSSNGDSYFSFKLEEEVATYSELSISGSVLIKSDDGVFQDWKGVEASTTAFPDPDELNEKFVSQVADLGEIEAGSEHVLNARYENQSPSDYSDRFALTFRSSEFDIDFKKYDNCASAELSFTGCVFTDLTLTSGAVYEISPDTPVTVNVPASVPGPAKYSVDSRIQPLDDYDQAAVDQSDAFEFSGDNQLVLSATSQDSIETYPSAQAVVKENPYDVEVSDTAVNGESGDTTELNFTVTNTSDATAIFPTTPGRGNGSFQARINLPNGVEPDATEFSEYNMYFNEELGHRCYVIEGREPHPSESAPVADYDLMCDGPDRIEVGGDFTFGIPVEITDESAADDGSVTVVDGPQYWDQEYYEEHFSDAGYVFDPYYFETMDGNLDNNTATLSLNPSTDDGGRLDKTGSSLTTVLGVAAGAIVLGSGAFIWSRRRSVSA